MAWDSSRPVPWKRLMRDWVLYVGIMVVVFLIIYRDRVTPGLFAGLFISGPMFVAIGAVLAKFGYTRKTMKDLKAESAVRASEKQATPVAASTGRPRSKPAPTKRTSGGSNRPSSKQRRR
ncbi:MAG: hypothetical protein WD023_09860 [Ilumatobacteraceae bacterium]